MSRLCTCHADRHALMGAGFTFHTSTRLMRKLHPRLGYYHEHRCECACGCKEDTLGWVKCVHCSFECKGRREVRPNLTRIAALVERARRLLPHLKRTNEVPVIKENES